MDNTVKRIIVESFKTDYNEFKEGLLFCLHYGDYEKSDNCHAEVVETKGGNEGDGEDMYLVIKIDHPDHGQAFVKFDGWFNSWSGGDYNLRPIYVKPVEKTITVFEEIK